MEPKNYVILIGGAPTVGKSTLTGMLAKHFNIPWISTDQINSVVKNVASIEKYPALFNADMSAEEFLNKYPKEEIIKRENEQSECVWDGMNGLLDHHYPWKSFIIEGVAILPEFVNSIKNDNKIVSIFLVDEDVDRIRDVIYKRGLFGPAKSYSDDVKEKEVIWCQEFSKQLKAECNKYGFKYFEVTKDDNDFERVRGYVESRITV